MRGRLPTVGAAAEAAEVVATASRLNAALKTVQSAAGSAVATALDEVDDDVIRTYALYAAAELQVAIRGKMLWTWAGADSWFKLTRRS